MHGIFPTHNHYYIVNEIFPYLSKKEIKEVYYPEKSKKNISKLEKTFRRKTEDEE
jgi:hypothetical protein